MSSQSNAIVKVEVIRYTSAHEPLWDAFVRASRNGVFLFERQYIDYHSDRFPDHSLLFFDVSHRLVAVLPATELTESGERVISSHGGLTFGGFVLLPEARSRDVLRIFDAALAYMRHLGFARFVYKAVPDIYHQLPSQEEEYALWLHGFHLEVCNLSTAIDLRCALPLRPDRNRLRGYRKAQRHGFTIVETTDLNELWPIVEHSLLQRHGVRPVHSLSEMSLLRSRFPSHIRTFVAMRDGKVEGGVVMFESAQVAHSQYAHASDSARSQGVIDYLYTYLIGYYQTHRPAIRYFDFGISNENRGRYLNPGLVNYKEDFGGRGVCYKVYSLELKKER